MRTFTSEQRRARLARRHLLSAAGDDVAGVASAVVALHATDPASVYLSAMARLADPSLDVVAEALYDDRTVARVLAMRRTLFVVPLDALPAVERSSTDAVARNERARLEGFLNDAGISDPASWLADAADEVASVLAPTADDDAPGAFARNITAMVPRLATKIVMGAGTKNEGSAGATSRVLATLANEGVLMRGRPTGAWTGRQYQWHLRSVWLGGRDPDPGSLSEAAASVDLVRRWLASFGPAPYADLKWWTGWKAPQLKAALSELGDEVAEVDIEREQGLVLASDLDDEAASAGWVALLPSLDPTPMGWKERDWFLDPSLRPQLFDRNGNVGPTVWVGGQVVGGWGQRPDGEVVYRLLRDVGTEAETRITDEAEKLSALVGDTVVKPSFPTPLQRELAGS